MKRKKQDKFSQVPTNISEPDLFPPALQGRATEFYTLSVAGDAMTCRRCSFTTRDPRHIEQKFCPNCLTFHEDRLLMARLSEGLEKELRVQARDSARLAA